MSEFLTQVGRIVGGHPMDHKPAMDDQGKPKIGKTGEPQLQTFIYFALPKNGTTDFKQTDFGQAMVAEAVASFPKGEHKARDFAWKVIDGDDTAPMKGGKPAPASREGFPGHWVLRLTTGIPVRCYNVGKYGPMDQIQDRNMIKAGDYGRMFLNIKGNASTQTPGLYLNPSMFELQRAGELIVSAGGPDAASAFGGSAPTTVATPPAAPAPAAAVPPPHNPLPKLYDYNGAKYTSEQLLASGWTAEQIAQLPAA